MSSIVSKLALVAVATLTAAGCDYDLALDDPATDAHDTMEQGTAGPRPRMTCTNGLPSITVEDEVRAVATCPKDEKPMKVVITCAAPPLVAKTYFEEIVVVCPEDVPASR
jgi:hypothetical protein